MIVAQQEDAMTDLRLEFETALLAATKRADWLKTALRCRYGDMVLFLFLDELMFLEI